MKFLTQALALALISISSVEARQSFSKHDFDQAVASGHVNHEKLLKNAVPYKQAVRRRAQDGEDERNREGYAGVDYEDDYQRVSLTSKFKVQFNSCLTLETENYNLLLDNLVNYAKDGTLVSVRNYVLLDVCDGDDCTPQTFMVDLTTFIEAVMDYSPSRKTMVCNACATYGEDVCGKTYYSNGGSNYQNNQGRRELSSKEYELFDENTCSLCEKYDCAYDSEGDQQLNFENIELWIAEIAECKQNDVQWLGLNTYSGWMCNADGSGIEIGVFIDQYCRMYNRKLNYVSMMVDQDYQYFFQSQEVIPYMFTDIIECRDLSYVQYVDQETYESIQSTQGNYYYGSGSVNDACGYLFLGEAVPRSLSYCGQARNYTDTEYAQQQAYFAQNYQQNANNNAYANNKYNQNYNGQNNGNNQAQYNGQNMYQYIQAQSMMYNNYGQDMSWYTYDLTAFEVMDGAAVCQKVKTKWTNAGYSTGKSAVQDSVATSSATGIQNVYSDTSSDSFWKWSNGGKSSSATTNSSSAASTSEQPTWLFPTRNQHSALQTADTKLSPLEIAWIVLLSVGATALFMHFTRKQVLKRRARKMIEKEVYIKTDDHGVPSPPLIIS